MRIMTPQTYVGPLIARSARRRCNVHLEGTIAPDTICPPDGQHKLLFLMVQRRDTMGFTDLVRGVYPATEPEKRRALETYMGELTCDERARLTLSPFRQIWMDLWYYHGKAFHADYASAKWKFDQVDIGHLLRTRPCNWTEKEYGFPKGRRNLRESIKQCAIREFEEETGYHSGEFRILSEKPVVEEFKGTNNKRYKHVYYLTFVDEHVGPPRWTNNIQQLAEIGNIAWLTYDQCVRIIRPYDQAKLAVLQQTHERFKHLCGCGDAGGEVESDAGAPAGVQALQVGVPAARSPYEEPAGGDRAGAAPDRLHRHSE
jgi:8-oxo-dGTP pyrophosphatase MutT (NUDIX family)